jgi:DNA polymerase III sliding clamp (beta) subunit (PCNA family)
MNLLDPASVAVSKTDYWGSARLCVKSDYVAVIARDNYLHFTTTTFAETDEEYTLEFGKLNAGAQSSVETLIALRNYIATLDPDKNCLLSVDNNGDGGLFLKVSHGRTSARFAVFVPDAEEPIQDNAVFARVPAGDLLRTIELVSPAIAQKDNIPALYGLYVHADERLTFAASDRYWGAIADFGDIEIISPINVVVNAEALKRALRVFDKLKPNDHETVTLSLAKSFVVFSVGNAAISAAVQGFKFFDIWSVFGNFPQKMAEVSIRDLVRAANLGKAFKFDGTRPLRFQFDLDKFVVSMRDTDGDFEFDADYRVPPEEAAKCQLSHAIFTKAVSALSASKAAHVGIHIAPTSGAMRIRSDKVRYMIMPMR